MQWLHLNWRVCVRPDRNAAQDTIVTNRVGVLVEIGTVA